MDSHRTAVKITRSSAHAIISLWWIVKQLLTCLYKGNRTLIVLLSLRLDPPLWAIVELQNRIPLEVNFS